MWLFAGLGNPGPEYLFTRHNFGWRAVALLAEKLKLTFRENSSLEALIAEGEEAVLLLPLTYMNLSGKAVARAVKRYEIPAERVLLVHDDLDLPLGRMKILPRGGSGGHRGVASVLAMLGTEEIPRLKLGIGRPPSGIPVPDYVLSPFSPEEEPLVERVLELSVAAMRTILGEGLSKAMSLYNRRDLLQNERKGAR
ncbi:MAG TPA: aminoacyl-tRNA hydrolase [Thermosulfurimonas dismutans]|uniref:Peptidyl-tRNA hydrolase n=1 Tax=Thermosulfurimonas dismutans TaxID=999894 RepID=A0A7C3GE27_9BACT|nr:aminoacyl-tRNA hydrolase [Thermosulfurimonas dismutans]